jgi:16S rRNA processing protein RimM
MVSAYDAETVVVGVVGRPHGLRGELSLRPYNTRGSAFAGARSLILERDGARRTHTVESLRPAHDTVIVKLVGIDDRDAAAALTLAIVRLPRAGLPPLGPGEFYVEDVVGCSVVGEDGAPLGVAVGTFWNGAHDVMTVVAEGAPGGEPEGQAAAERLIPLVPEFVVAVDVPGRRIQVRWSDDE